MTQDSEHRPLSVGDRLPIGSVVTTDGATVQLRPSARRATILVVTHPDGCQACRSYLTSLDEGLTTLDRWAARPLAIVGNGSDADRLGFPAAVDADGRLRRQLGIDDGDVAVVVADRHGEVWAATGQSGHDDLPTVAELEQEVRFIAIQCPECEVPDTAALGEWAAPTGA